MKLVAIMPVRNEGWVLGLSLRAALMWCDEVLILDHASTDNSAQIIAEVMAEDANCSRVRCWTNSDPVWREMQHRNFLLNMARDRSATHVAIVDADEVLSGNLIPAVHEDLFACGMKEGFRLELPWACLARGTSEFYVEGQWFNNWVTTAFKLTDDLHWSAEKRGGYDFHHREPMGRKLTEYRPVKQRAGGLMHLQFVDERRLRAKQALYKVTERIRWNKPSSELNEKYNPAVYGSDPSKFRLASVPSAWWEPYGDLMHHLKLGEEPWQERAVKDAIAEHGRARFSGLDLFGVA